MKYELHETTRRDEKGRVIQVLRIFSDDGTQSEESMLFPEGLRFVRDHMKPGDTFQEITARSQYAVQTYDEVKEQQYREELFDAGWSTGEEMNMD